MHATIQDIADLMRLLHLSDSLAFLSHLLGVSRRERNDPILEPILGKEGHLVPPFLCHFFAKHIILNSSDVGYCLNWTRYRRLHNLYFDLDDPIIGAPGFKNADPTAGFERLLAHQLAPQKPIPSREYGLALSLFQDAQANPKGGYDLRRECEEVLGMPVERFMQLGLLTTSAQSARRTGFVTKGDLQGAFRVGFKMAASDFVDQFLRQVACTPEQFRDACESPEFRVEDRFATSEFNPLSIYPLVELSSGSYVVPDHELILERTTWGIFHDLFRERRTRFSEDFGDVFARLVGQLLESVYSVDELWSDESSTKVFPQAAGKKCDWAYKGARRTVLIECKSARPTLTLTAQATEKSVDEAALTVAKALRQLIQHDAAIQRGEWLHQGLRPGPTVHMVVTFGHFSTLNGPFFRARVRKQLAELQVPFHPFALLSIQEFDCVIRLIEDGNRLDDLAKQFSTSELFNLLYPYQKELSKMAVSSFARERTDRFLEGIQPDVTNVGTIEL